MGKNVKKKDDWGKIPAIKEAQPRCCYADRCKQNKAHKTLWVERKIALLPWEAGTKAIAFDVDSA